MVDDARTGTWQAYGRNPFRDQHEPGNGPAAGSPRFADYLAAHLPEVAATVDESDFDVLHSEVDALKLATRNAILRGDWPTVGAHFVFVDNMLESADIELHDAIGISYLVNLFYGETSADFAKARTLMPKRLATALEIMERHYEELR